MCFWCSGRTRSRRSSPAARSISARSPARSMRRCRPATSLPTFDALFKVATAQLPLALDHFRERCMPRARGRAGRREPLCALGGARPAAPGLLWRRRRHGGAQRRRTAAFAGDRRDDARTTRSPTRKSPIVTKAPLLAPAPSRDIVFWAQGFGAWGKFNGDGNAATVRRDLAGFFTGVDARFDDGRAGIAAGYTGSRNNLDGRGSADCRERASRGLWRLEFRRAEAARRRRLMRGTPSTPTARSRSRASSTAPPRITTAAPGRFSARPATASRSARSRSSRSPAPPGCICSTDAFNERGGAAALASRRTVRGRLLDARRPRRQHDPARRRHGAGAARLGGVAARLRRRDAAGDACVPGAPARRS